MLPLFMIKDTHGRTIRLPYERWKHILREHPDVHNLEELQNTILHPTTMKPSKYDPVHVVWYYRYNKIRKHYLFVSVKYLNDEGFIITSYYMRTIQWNKKCLSIMILKAIS